MSTHNILVYDKMIKFLKKYPEIFAFLRYRKKFHGTHKRVRFSNGKRGFGILVIKIFLRQEM